MPSIWDERIAGMPAPGDFSEFGMGFPSLPGIYRPPTIPGIPNIPTQGPQQPPGPVAPIPRPQAAAGPPMISLPPSTVPSPDVPEFHLPQQQSFPTRGAARMSNIMGAFEGFQNANRAADAQRQKQLIERGKAVREMIEAAAQNPDAAAGAAAQQKILSVPGNREALAAAYPGMFPEVKDTRGTMGKILGGVKSAITGVRERPKPDISGVPNLPTQTAAQRAAIVKAQADMDRAPLEAQLDKAKLQAAIDLLEPQKKAALAQLKSEAAKAELLEAALKGQGPLQLTPEERDNIARHALGLPVRAAPNLQAKTGTIDGKPAVASFDPATGKYFVIQNGQKVDVTGKFLPKEEKEGSKEQQYLNLAEELRGNPAPERRAEIQAKMADIEKLIKMGPEARGAMIPIYQMGSQPVVDSSGNVGLPMGNRRTGEVTVTGVTPAASFKADQAALQKLTTNRALVSAFESTAQRNLDQFLQAAQSLSDTGSPWLNRPIREVQQQAMGDPKVAAAMAARTVALNEIARVVSNPNLVGVMSDAARKEVESLSPQGATLAQIKAVANILKQDMANRLASFDREIAETQKRLGQGRSKGNDDPLGIR